VQAGPPEKRIVECLSILPSPLHLESRITKEDEAASMRKDICNRNARSQCLKESGPVDGSRVCEREEVEHDCIGIRQVGYPFHFLPTEGS
jgi:hypothetical protein